MPSRNRVKIYAPNSFYHVYNRAHWFCKDAPCKQRKTLRVLFVAWTVFTDEVLLMVLQFNDYHHTDSLAVLRRF